MPVLRQHTSPTTSFKSFLPGEASPQDDGYLINKLICTDVSVAHPKHGDLQREPLDPKPTCISSPWHPHDSHSWLVVTAPSRCSACPVTISTLSSSVPEKRLMDHGAPHALVFPHRARPLRDTCTASSTQRHFDRRTPTQYLHPSWMKGNFWTRMLSVICQRLRECSGAVPFLTSSVVPPSSYVHNPRQHLLLLSS